MPKITLKQGLDTNLDAATLLVGELAFVTDTNKLYIGTDSDKVLINPDASTTAETLSTARAIGITGDDFTATAASFDGSADVNIALALTDTGVTAGTYTSVTVDAKGRVTAATTLTASDIPSLTLSKISDAGTAAGYDVGTASGEIPVLGDGGVLSSSVIPAIAIISTTTVADTAAMLALDAQQGDVAINTDEGQTYILAGDDPTVESNWVAIVTTAVQSVNGYTGVVTLAASDVGLGNVTNESKETMFASPTFTGTVTAPTADVDTIDTTVATTAWVAAYIDQLTISGGTF